MFNAPRELVFRTVIDPLQIPNWWGHSRFTTQVINMIVMRGGTWHFIQRGKDGKEYGYHGVYHDVVIPEHLVYTSEYDGMPGQVTLETDAFEEQDGKTIINSTVIFPSVEDRDQKLQWGMEEGANAMTTRLNELLERQLMHERRDFMMTKMEIVPVASPSRACSMPHVSASGSAGLTPTSTCAGGAQETSHRQALSWMCARAENSW